jgi:streptomycin 6-kinase
VILIMNRSSMASTIRAALPAQVLLQMRLRHRLHGDVHLGEIAHEPAGYAEIPLNGDASQARVLGEMLS